jgi:hypothetical protein
MRLPKMHIILAHIHILQLTLTHRENASSKNGCAQIINQQLDNQCTIAATRHKSGPLIEVDTAIDAVSVQISMPDVGNTVNVWWPDVTSKLQGRQASAKRMQALPAYYQLDLKPSARLQVPIRHQTTEAPPKSIRLSSPMSSNVKSGSIFHHLTDEPDICPGATVFAKRRTRHHSTRHMDSES